MVAIEFESLRRHRMLRTKQLLPNLNPDETKQLLLNLNLDKTKWSLSNLNLKEGIGCQRLNGRCQI